MKTYKVVVVGMGKRGNHHAQAFHDNERFDVVGICDLDKERLEAAASSLGNPAIGTDAKALCKDIKPDVFCFCTLPNLRYKMIEFGVESGASLIAYEKPIAESSQEAAKIMEFVRKAGVKTVVSHQHRYGEHYQKVKEIISSGKLGRIHTVYGYSMGWMMHMMTHLIDYMRWFNSEAEAGWAMGQAAGKGKFSDLHRSPDYIGGLINFSNGVRGIVECGAGVEDIPEVDYWWRKCRIGAQGTDGYAEVLTGGGWRAVTKEGSYEGEGCMNYDKDMPPYIQDMANWLDNDAAIHPCDGESAYKGFQIMMAICRSAVQGGQVKLPLEALDNNDLGNLESHIDSTVFATTAENTKEYL